MSGVEVLLRLGMQEADLRIETPSLRVDHLQNAAVADGVALTGKLDVAGRARQRIRLRGDQLPIVRQSIERVRDLTEGLENDFLVARRVPPSNSGAVIPEISDQAAFERVNSAWPGTDCQPPVAVRVI